MIQGEESSITTKAQLREMLWPDPNKPKPEAELVKKIDQATKVIYGWDHTGNPGKRIAGDPEQALKDLAEAEEFLEGLRTGDSEKDTLLQRVLDEISEARQGFQYRQEHGLESIYGQRDLIRKEMSKMFRDPEAGKRLLKMMEELKGQQDGKILYDILQGEYHMTIELMEELSELGEEGQDFVLSGDELFDKIFGFNKTGEGGRKRAAEKYQRARSIGRNVDLIKPLLILQGKDRTLEDVVGGQERMEQGAINGAINELAEEIGRLQMYKGVSLEERLTITKHEDIEDTVARIEALIADIESELQLDPEDSNEETLLQERRDIQGKIDSLNKKKKSKVFEWQVKLKMASEEDIDKEIKDLVAQRNRTQAVLSRIYGAREAYDRRAQSVKIRVDEAKELIEAIKKDS